MSDKPSKNKQAAKGCLLVVISSALVVTCAVLTDDGKKTAQETSSQTADLFAPWYVAARPDGSHLIVWKDQASMDKGFKLIRAGEAMTHVGRMMDLVACFIDPGTKLVSTDTGMFTSTIEVVSGPNDGCEGVIDNSGMTHAAPPVQPPASPSKTRRP